MQSTVKGFLSHVCLKRSREDDIFTGDLGDLIVVTLANIMRRGIVIFTSSCQIPVLTGTLAFGTVESIQPIWLAYSQVLDTLT